MSTCASELHGYAEFVGVVGLLLEAPGLTAVGSAPKVDSGLIHLLTSNGLQSFS
jgi:hypothetical protein